MADSIIAEIPKLLDTARKRWDNTLGLVIAEVIPFIFYILIPKFPYSDYIKYILLLIAEIAIYFVWRKGRRLPRTKKGKVGIVICISAEEEAERAKIKEDFIRTLHELLKQGQSGQYIQILNVPDYIASQTKDQDDASKLLKKSRAHFIIYGRVRLRKIGNGESHILDLESIVTHKPIPKNISVQFSQEFSELFPRKLNLARENDYLLFSFTSEWINCVAKYIIGIAAFLSGDFNYADQIQNDVQKLVESGNKGVPIFKKLKDRVPIRLTQINLSRANISYRRWYKHRSPVDMLEVGNYLSKIPLLYAELYPVLLLKAIYTFVYMND